ncbi:MAG: hypothetical protein CMJ26_05210 [Phycisphaerae bacterium]|nr:hypothetical protein [Phycisphaerae bacterium]
MMGVGNAIERRFHVLNPVSRSMGAEKGLIPFLNTPVGEELKNSTYKTYSVHAVLFSAFIFFTLYWFVNLVIVVSLIIIISVAILSRVKAHVNIPISVNLNHPFMDSEAISKSEVMVRFSQDWIEPGIHRLKLVKDALHGWTIHKQDDQLSILSIWDTKLSEKILTRQLSIINQAISLNNAINESNDEFEDARERESLESTLLEREWLPEDEIEVQGPISRMFSSE